MHRLSYPFHLVAIVSLMFGCKTRSQFITRLFAELVMHYVLNKYTRKCAKSVLRIQILHMLRTCIVILSGLLTFQLSNNSLRTWVMNFISIMLISFELDNQFEFKVLVNSILFKGICNLLMFMLSGGSIHEIGIILNSTCTAALILYAIFYFTKLYGIRDQKMFAKHDNVYALLSAISNVILRIDGKLKITYMQNSFNGKPAQHFIGKPLWTIITDEQSKQQTMHALQYVYSTKQPTAWKWKCLVRNKKGNLKEKTFQSVAAPLIQDKKVYGFMIVASDITYQFVSQHKKALIERAKNRSQSMNDFISSMSRQIRESLQAIMCSLHLLLLTHLNRIQKEYVEDMIEAAKLLTSIVGNVLDLSKIDSSATELINAPMSILGIVDNTAEVFSSLAVKKGLYFINYVDPRIPVQCIGDATRIAQILNNFLSNALKFTTKGYIQISAELLSQTDSTSTILFKCKDTGIGIAEEHQSAIFKHFVQVEGGNQPAKPKGWGLGLAIVKKLVKLMNGQMGMESRVGEGSTFWVALTFEHTKMGSIQDAMKPSKYKNVVVIHRSKEVRQKCTRYLYAMRVRKVSELQSGKELHKFANQEVALIFDEMDNDIFHFIKNHKKLKKAIVLSDSIKWESKLYNHLPKEKKALFHFVKRPIKLNNFMEALAGNRNNLLSTTAVNSDLQLVKRDKHFDTSFSVIIADDNKLVLTLLQTLLNCYGIYNVTCVRSGTQLISNLRWSDPPFNIILMSLNLPDMDGFEAAKKIRQLNKSRIPIIATTAESSTQMWQKCVSCGINELLMKPVPIETIIQTIRRYI